MDRWIGGQMDKQIIEVKTLQSIDKSWGMLCQPSIACQSYMSSCDDTEISYKQHNQTTIGQLKSQYNIFTLRLMLRCFKNCWRIFQTKLKKVKQRNKLFLRRHGAYSQSFSEIFFGNFCATGLFGNLKFIKHS